MKQAQRKLVYLVLASIIAIITAPVWIIGFVCSWICEKIAEISDILKYLLRIYDRDESPNKDNVTDE